MKTKTLRDVVSEPIYSAAICKHVNDALEGDDNYDVAYFMERDEDSGMFSTGIFWFFVPVPEKESQINKVKVRTYFSVRGNKVSPVSLVLDGDKESLAYSRIQSDQMREFIRTEKETIEELNEPFVMTRSDYLVKGDIVPKAFPDQEAYSHCCKVSALSVSHALELATPEGWIFVRSPSVSRFTKAARAFVECLTPGK